MRGHTFHALTNASRKRQYHLSPHLSRRLLPRQLSGTSHAEAAPLICAARPFGARVEAPSREPRLLEGGGRARDAISTKSGWVPPPLSGATTVATAAAAIRDRDHRAPCEPSRMHERYETTRWAPSEGRRRAVQQPLKLPRQHRKMAQRYQCRHTRRPALVPRRPSRRVACVRQHPPRVPPARPVTSGVERARPAGDGAAR